MQVKWVMSVLVGAALLSACGDGSASGSSTTAPVNLNSTSFATLAPTLSSLPPEVSVPEVGQISTVGQDYTIVAGDVPVNVAKRFGVSLDALNLANVNTPNYAKFYVNTVIKIPEGALVPAPTTTIAPGTDTPAVSVATTTTAAANASGCTTGSYVILDGDLPGRVAKKFDVTVAQLDAANANTSGYKNFIVGVTIVIPCT